MRKFFIALIFLILVIIAACSCAYAAVGGIVTGETKDLLNNLNINIEEVLKNNDAYNALKAVNSLVMTGPTGTNVNDFAVALIN